MKTVQIGFMMNVNLRKGTPRKLMKRAEAIEHALTGITFPGDVSHMTDVVEALESIVSIARRAAAVNRNRKDRP